MGRPRSEAAREAALSATVDLVLEEGIDGVTFDEVAERSGVAKTTLYRHFGTKQKMLVEAAFSCYVEQPTPDTGDLATDLELLFDKAQSVDEQRRIPDMQRALLAAGDRDVELRDLATAMGEERQRPIRTVLQLAQLRGEIGRDVDLDVAVAMIFGPFVMRKMIDRQEVTPEFRAAVLRHMLVLLRATAESPVGASAS
jgi:AcrR family transcriptional regulator